MSEGVSEADRTGALSQAELLGTEMYDLGLTEPLTACFYTLVNNFTPLSSWK